jgi:hypothetical protein
MKSYFHLNIKSWPPKLYKPRVRPNPTRLEWKTLGGRYHFSGGWVFTGWIGFSQWIKHEVGDYPQRAMLINLGRMSKVEREEHTWFGLYLWGAMKAKGR